MRYITNWMNNARAKVCHMSAIAFALLIVPSAFAANLKDIQFQAKEGSTIEVRLKFDEPVSLPREFSTNNPARLSLDFNGVKSSLATKTKQIGVGNLNSITAIEAGDRMRVVVKLLNMVPHSTSTDGSDIVLTLGESKATSKRIAQTATPKATENLDKLSMVDFRRGEAGEGRILIKLPNPNTSIDLRQEGKKVIADIVGVSVEDELIRKLDVVDFATPVKTIDTSRKGNSVTVQIDTLDEFEYLAYQADNLFTIELKPLTKEEKEELMKKRFQYTGERINFNFQNTSVREFLQVIAEIANINMVTSDTVTGQLSIRMENVPWDQALDIVLQSKGLDKRINGNVMRVAPATELAEQERRGLEAKQQVQELAPLRTEYIQVNYAKAEALAALLKSEENSLLSERGSVTIDERTNMLLVQDTSEKLEEVRRLVESLDIPVRQVLIEARIVTATDGFEEEFGVRFGFNDRNSQSAIGGSLEAASEHNSSRQFPTGDSRLNVNLGADTVSNAASIGLSLARLSDGTLLDLELSALESENQGEVVASPRIITSNQKKARVQAGTEIPYEAAAASGATTVQFKDAVLGLDVTPQITPDGNIILDLLIQQDSVGDIVPGGVAINTQDLETQVLARNGETIVLGGIYITELTQNEDKVPLLGDIPGVGWLFKHRYQNIEKREWLIFITPKIISEELVK